MTATFGQFLTALIKTKVVQTDENVGTNDKKDFIQLNGLSLGYKGTLKFLKAVILFMYGFVYPSLFRSARRNQIMKRFVTSNFISKINDNSFCFTMF